MFRSCVNMDGMVCRRSIVIVVDYRVRIIVHITAGTRSPI
jgi:hypothetical protein